MMNYLYPNIGFLCLITGISISLIGIKSYATLPDQETYNFVSKQYNLLIHTSRDGCSYYANPQTLKGDNNNRMISVLLTRGDISGGSGCNGVFQFLRLQVRCQTQEISYSEDISSPANFTENWQSNLGVANRICSL